MKLSLCQIKPNRDWKISLDIAHEALEQAAAQGAELALLPELFPIPYEFSLVERCAQPIDGPIGRLLSAWAKEYGLWLVGGSFPLQEEGKRYNACPVYSPDGKLVALHKKIHLFDVKMDSLSVQEADCFSPGETPTVFDSPWGKIGVAICFDLRFPNQFLRMAEQGAELMVVPAAFNTVTGPRHFRLLAQARAVDSQSFVAVCGPALDETASYHSYGHSLAVSPMGRVLGELDSAPGILTLSLDLKQADTVRKKLPVLVNQKPGLDRPNFSKQGKW